MRTDSKIIKVTYKHIEISPEELQQRLDDTFDLLFRETMENFKDDDLLDQPLASSLSNCAVEN